MDIVEIDLESGKPEIDSNSFQRNVNYSKSAHSLNFTAPKALTKSSDLLNEPNLMKRSASSYTTYTSQIRNRYTSKSVSNLQPQTSSSSSSKYSYNDWSQPVNNHRGSTQWYKPKPLQLPAATTQSNLKLFFLN